MEVNGDAQLLNNDDDDLSSHDNKKCNGMYWSRYWFVAVGLCLLSIEVIAIICTFSYKTTYYDESDSDLAKVSVILLIIGLVGQIRCCGLSLIAEEIQKCGGHCNDQQGNNLCLVCLLLLTIPAFGPLQLIASILMMVNNTENDTANVKVFGAFIIIMDIIATVLSIVYGVGTFCCGQDNSRKENTEL